MSSFVFAPAPRRSSLGRPLVALSLLAGLASARADSTIRLSGTISSVSGTAAFAVNRPFTITFTLSSGVPDSQPAPTQIGTYDNAISAYEFNYDGGAYVGTAAGGRFFVYNNFELGTDAVQMDLAGSTNFAAVDGNDFASGSSGPYFFLTNNSGLLFGSDALPDPFPTTGWDSGRFMLAWGESMFGFGETAIQVDGNITSVTAVPEPASAASLVAACALAAAARRRGRRG